MSVKRTPASSLDSAFGSAGGGAIGSSDIEAFGDMLVEVGDSFKAFANIGSGSASSDS